MIRRRGWILLVIAILGGHAAQAASPGEAANWTVQRGLDRLTGRDRCLLQSKVETIHDGHDDVPIQLVLTGDAMLVVTESNIDLTYPGIGLRVDRLDPIPIDRLFKDTMVVFDHETSTLIEAFIKGYQATISLGFWPTWPRGETQSTRFSLLGFTNAYHAFRACEADAPL
jgi:hypothetical protein